MVGYFHWPFLANVSLAFDMITAYGGSRWCNDMILRWAGKNPVGLASLKSDNALEVYGEFFTNPETIRASNEDYRAGAFEDVDMQTEDQKAGRKIARNLGVLLVYSSDYIGRRHDVESEWRGWVEEGTHVKSSGLGNGIGHFLPEEAPQETAKVIREWLEELGVGV
ncbi:haloacetate dehalogenase [Lindgomyces ingoldianus]|uniref:Haloacetate dehalogenase n=1 Tax=Lindgomyces ingoldianus TaxID=673940 RepID=A0ACB6RG44_9PLEO|nr:haloacetate dehalogenase [Lindgomyces ingoldianus]KAF2478239.1 haloacetate dehalogenase [Lindgomyces ingoldianus]